MEATRGVQTREERAEELLEQGKSVVKTAEGYLVPSQTSADVSYLVTKRNGKIMCDCPDFKKNGNSEDSKNGDTNNHKPFYCKHIRYLRMAIRRGLVAIEKSPTATLLEFPMRADQIKQRSDGLNYIEWACSVQRLNDSLGFDGWSFEIVSQVMQDSECITHGRLTVYGPHRAVIKEQWGAHVMPYKKGTDESAMTMGELRKASCSDALKRCAVLLGIGIELYCDDHSYQSFQSSL